MTAFLRKLLSRTTGLAARLPIPKPLRRAVYGPYVRHYGVNLAECEHPLNHYHSFQALFTRRLRPGCRPIDPDPRVLTSPVDGYVSAVGPIEENRLFQAKGIHYTLEALLQGEEAGKFIGGNFATLYLSPADCHRIFAPCDLRVRGSRRIGGNLFSVQTKVVEKVPELFCRNERLLIELETDQGPACLILVGALNVGGMELLREPGDEVKKGEELALFKLGSTVILLFPRGRVSWNAPSPGNPVRIGKKIGELARHTVP